MFVFRLLGRLLLASLFVDSGLDLYRHPGPRAALGAKNLPSTVTDNLPVEVETAARANAVAMVAAGSTMALGILPRLSATILAATLVPTTYVGHPFWGVEDPQQRRMQRIHFLKNVSLGGALMVIAGGGGRG
ncbi:MAG: DoxX family membrane protein [Candidatus Dormibacteria bacterium]